MSEPDTNALEEAAGEQLGVEEWDRPAIFRESADAATDNGLPYWLVLLLSGAIATLGLAMNSSAVVIGAMLVAPLLAPIMGLALSLAVGDGRLAVQTAAVVVGSTAAVIAVAAGLTVLLPFQTITLEISARARPTTLDLAIAIFSGLVGAVVTVARGSRLSAAIPGVAIAVALIPPLGVAGFGIGIGWNRELIWGSMLLYGANLAGIVLSGMGVFLLIGMHRSDVVKVALSWRERVEPHGLAALADRPRWVQSLGVVSSPRARIALVGAFVVALGFPLSETLGQIAREARVERAVDEVGRALFSVEGSASILNRQVVYGSDRTRVYLRVATTGWLGADAREEFERRASALANEPIRLSLEQIPASGEDISDLSSVFGAPSEAAAPSAAPLPPDLNALLAATGDRLQGLLAEVALPDGVILVGAELGATPAGGGVLRIGYAADQPLPPAASEMLRRQIMRKLEGVRAEVRVDFVSTAPRLLSGAPADTAILREIDQILALDAGLVAEVLAPGVEEPPAAAAEALDWLRQSGGDDRVRLVREAGEGVRIRIVARGSDPSPPPREEE